MGLTSPYPSRPIQAAWKLTPNAIVATGQNGWALARGQDTNPDIRFPANWSALVKVAWSQLAGCVVGHDSLDHADTRQIAVPPFAATERLDAPCSQGLRDFP